MTSYINQFMSIQQATTIRAGTRGEEGKFFSDKIVEINQTIHNMPKTYETDSQGDSAIVYLHYFINNCDWYITEKDMEAEQHQAFGLADLGNGGELGYISIVELTKLGAELDFYWQAKSLSEVKK